MFATHCVGIGAAPVTSGRARRERILTASSRDSALFASIRLLSSAEDMQRPPLPESLDSIQKAEYFPAQRHRWNTNEEIASTLISFDKHEDWLSKEVKIRQAPRSQFQFPVTPDLVCKLTSLSGKRFFCRRRLLTCVRSFFLSFFSRPKSGSIMLYSRKRVRYRRDGYCWKKRKDGKTTREDHMKLKVQGTECIYGCYVHSAILPTFHRRCYWLLQVRHHSFVLITLPCKPHSLTATTHIPRRLT